MLRRIPLQTREYCGGSFGMVQRNLIDDGSAFESPIGPCPTKYDSVIIS